MTALVRPGQTNDTDLHAGAPGGWLRKLSGRGEAIALVGDARELSFSALDTESAQLAEGLVRLGLRPGDCIAIWLPNTPDWMVAHFASARAGLTTIPINTWARVSEVEHFLRLGKCRAIILDTSFRGIDFDGILLGALDALEREGDNSLGFVIDVASLMPRDPIAGPARISWSDMALHTPAPPAEAVHNMAMVAFSTSGTTSQPKLAIHKAAALIDHAKAVSCAAEMTASEVVLCALPPCGAYGYGLILASLASGAKAILCDTFDLDKIVRCIETEKVTLLAITEPLLRGLLDHPCANRKTLKSLRLVFSAGGTLEEVVCRAEKDFGFLVSNVYGSSEVLAMASFWSTDVGIGPRSAAGGVLVHQDMCVRAVGPSGETLPVGVSGELQFRGPILLEHYLGNPGATDKAFKADGWFSSQDVGVVLDDGGKSFHYIARSNDALRLSGFLVNPGEIETMLQSHPMVAMAQVVGVPKGGEDITVAFVLPVAGANPTQVELQAYCRSLMASYKSPSIVRIVDHFPTIRSANGDKVIKQDLRAMARACL